MSDYASAAAGSHVNPVRGRWRLFIKELWFCWSNQLNPTLSSYSQRDLQGEIYRERPRKAQSEVANLPLASYQHLHSLDVFIIRTIIHLFRLNLLIRNVSRDVSANGGEYLACGWVPLRSKSCSLSLFLRTSDPNWKAALSLRQTKWSQLFEIDYKDCYKDCYKRLIQTRSWPEIVCKLG